MSALLDINHLYTNGCDFLERLSNKRSLYIEEIDSSDQYETIKGIVEEWSLSAKTKRRRSLDRSEISLFLDSEAVTSSIVSTLENKGAKSLSWNRILVCRDVALNKMQAIVLVNITENRTISVAHVATHPNNIRASINLSIPNRVEGACRFIFIHLAKIALKQNKVIRLISSESAYSFYLKLNFRKIDEEDDMNEMELTEEGAEDLVEKHSISLQESFID